MAVNPFLSPRRGPRPLLLGVVAVAVVAAVAAVVLFVRAGSSGQAADLPLNAAPPGPPTGYDAAGADKVLKQCLDEKQRADAHGAHVYNVVVTGYATDALIYSPTWLLGCMDNPNGSGGKTLSVGRGQTGWLSGPATVDLVGGENSHSWMKQPGYDVVGGRVPSRIKRVTITIGGKTVSVPTVNGTYLRRITRDKPVPVGGEGPPPTVIRTFDADGHQVGVLETGPGKQHCVVTPDGKRLDAAYPLPGPCVTASPWK